MGHELLPETNARFKFIRHSGPKSPYGALTKVAVRHGHKHFAKCNYLDDQVTDCVFVWSSPKGRADDTRTIFLEEIEGQVDTRKIRVLDPTPLLDEGVVADYISHHYEYEQETHWMEKWLTEEVEVFPGMKTARAVVKDVSQWVWDHIKLANQVAANYEIFAFTHGPVMGAFLYRLQERLNTQLLGNDWKVNFDRQLGFLSEFNLWYSSNDHRKLLLTFSEKTLSVPIDLIREMAELPINNT